jgi:hypothetical protein
MAFTNAVTLHLLYTFDKDPWRHIAEAVVNAWQYFFPFGAK